MATLVSFHAHPDDEAISVGGTLARASDAGHRVIVVFATRGEHGEVDDGVLAPGEAAARLADILREASADVLTIYARQIADTSLFLSIPPQMFLEAFGNEWFIHQGLPPGLAEDDLLAGLD